MRRSADIPRDSRWTEHCDPRTPDVACRLDLLLMLMTLLPRGSSFMGSEVVWTIV